MNFRGAVLLPVVFFSVFLTFLSAQTSTPELKSGDASIRHDGNEWVLSTALAERRIRFADGQLTLVSLRNSRSGKEYCDPAAPASELSFTMNGQPADGPWKLRDQRSTRGKQGELQLDLELASASLRVTRHYVLYPGTALVREWLTIENSSTQPVHIANLSFLHARVVGLQNQEWKFHYITGGGNYNASQLLKVETVAPGYHRTFDSNGGIQPISYSSYLPLAFLHDANAREGIAAGWDYLGHWDLTVSRSTGAQVEMSFVLAGYEKDLPPAGQIETPKAFLAAFSGGIDELGNQLLDWQYAYLWDFTNPDYFAKTRWAVDWPDPWVGDGGTPSADNWGRRLALDLRYVDLLRETGTDILWDDAGWYDKWGSWTAPDWKQTTDYLRKHDMRWVLWYPTFLATPQSKVGTQHPDWLIPGQKTLEQSIPATADWQARLLDDSVRDWGNYQWRYDIAPAASANDTDSLAADQNFRKLIEGFKAKYPQSGVDACHGGGRWISYDLARLSESGEYTDGGVGPYSPYYASLIVPPDKLHNVVDFDHTYYVPATDRTHLCMNPTWYRDPGDGPDVDAIRKDWELYHYMVEQGVAGRWSHVFRPQVEHDDPAWYFQRMNREGAKGVILTKHARSGATYYVTSRLTRPSAQNRDRYRGGAGDMNAVVTTSAATLTNAVYQDPFDGAVRHYGIPGQEFGPLNVKYQSGAQEQSLVTKITRLGAERKVEGQFFGMALQVDAPLTITQIGQFDPGVNPGQFDFGGNQGVYTLSVVRAEDGVVVATAELDMGQAPADAMGFKYARLRQPLRLEPAAPPVVIYPRGLQPALTYEVTAISKAVQLRQSGAELMQKGIRLNQIAPGEILFLNLPNYPGSGTDHAAPSAPAQVSKRSGHNLGVQGVEISWQPAKDNNWISYYEVRKKGKVIGKTAKGNFFFDHSETARHDLDAVYEVAAVDGDGNRSGFVLAQKTGGAPQIYEALGDFSPVQAARQWTYEQADVAGEYEDLLWDKGGYEGRWAGSGLGRIGRVWMQPSASYDISRTFIVPATGTVDLTGVVRKDPSAENQYSNFVRILRNGEQVWPAQGWAEVHPDYDSPTLYKVENLHVAAGDKLRFVVQHNGTNRADPMLWNPVITYQSPAAGR
ncbi:MAG: hypothetical protein JST79_15700 [Acidobacteria bacterium]|nr:hypothetical protein [Acidobacteriota bacterium]